MKTHDGNGTTNPEFMRAISHAGDLLSEANIAFNRGNYLAAYKEAVNAIRWLKDLSEIDLTSEREQMNGDDAAFPNPERVIPSPFGDFANDEHFKGCSGLTKREHFASMAMQGLLAQHETTECESGARDLEARYVANNNDRLVSRAVAIADALIEALSRPVLMAARESPNQKGSK